MRARSNCVVVFPYLRCSACLIKNCFGVFSSNITGVCVCMCVHACARARTSANVREHECTSCMHEIVLSLMTGAPIFLLDMTLELFGFSFGTIYVHIMCTDYVYF